MPGALKVKVNGTWTEVPMAPDPAVAVNRWNSAWGVLGMGAFTFTPSVALGAGATITHQLNWQARAGRRYLLHLQLRAVSSDTAGTNVTIQLKNHGTNLPDGNLLHWRWYSTYDTKVATWAFEPTSDQEYGIQVFVGTVSGVAPTVYSSGPSYYYVEDVGPIVPAAINPPAATPYVVAAGNALGVIAKGWPRADQPVSTSASVNVPLTYTLTWRSIAGRRYRIVFNARAVTTGTTRLIVESNSATHPGTADRYIAAYTSYDSMRADWLIDGDNTDWATTIVAAAGGVLSFYPTEFYVEDVGPNQSPALPIPETPPAWQPFPFAAGWRNYQVTSEYGPCGYRKIGDMVFLRGLAQTDSASGTITTTIGTLPVGFRPAIQEIFNPGSSIAGGPSTWRTDAYRNGNIIVTGSAPATGQWWSLAGIQFSTTL